MSHDSKHESMSYTVSLSDHSGVTCSKDELLDNLMGAQGFQKMPDEGEGWKGPETIDPDANWGYVKAVADIKITGSRGIVKAICKALRLLYPNEDQFLLKYGWDTKGIMDIGGTEVEGLGYESRVWTTEEAYDAEPHSPITEL